MTKKWLKPVALASYLIPLALVCTFLIGCNNKYFTLDKDKVEHGAKSNLATIDNIITLAQVTKDVSYLASDELKGRDNFSPEIHQAANFIAKRFKEVALIPSAGTVNFKQHYSIKKITPKMLTVEINGQAIASETLSMVTTIPHFEWHSDHLPTKQQRSISDLPVNTVIIGENVNMRKTLGELNRQGGQHLVLLHPKHKKNFKRYQSFFANGVTKLVNEASNEAKEATENMLGGVIVLALTDISLVKQFHVKGNAAVSETRLSNVVGILPGKNKVNEIVLFSAHYDHLGIKPNIKGKLENNDIFNGADDNASGVAAIINLANYFAKMNNNERTLMFAALSAEEIGGFGSHHLSSQIDPNRITAMINIEMIGKPAIFGEGSVWMTGMERSNLGEKLNQALAPQHLKIYADPYPKQNLFYRSDNARFASLGVPAHSFSSAQLDKDQHYHQVTDDINSLHISSMLQVIKMLAIATTPLVDGSITPSQIPPDRVKSNGLIY